MPTATVTNTSSERRTWGRLADLDTNHPLDLAPGESGRVEIPEGFRDPWLDIDLDPPPAPFVPVSVPPVVPFTDEPSDSSDSNQE